MFFFDKFKLFKRYGSLKVSSFRKKEFYKLLCFLHLFLKYLYSCLFHNLMMKRFLLLLNISRLLKINLSSLFQVKRYYSSGCYSYLYNLSIPTLSNHGIFLYSSYISVESSSCLSFYYNLFLFYLCSFYSIYISSFFFNGYASLPAKRKLFTVLKSPHTDKKSREQFLLQTNHRLLKDFLCFYYLIYKYFSSLFKFNLLFQFKVFFLHCFY